MSAVRERLVCGPGDVWTREPDTSPIPLAETVTRGGRHRRPDPPRRRWRWWR